MTLECKAQSQRRNIYYLRQLSLSIQSNAENLHFPRRADLSAPLCTCILSQLWLSWNIGSESLPVWLIIGIVWASKRKKNDRGQTSRPKRLTSRRTQLPELGNRVFHSQNATKGSPRERDSSFSWYVCIFIICNRVQCIVFLVLGAKLISFKLDSPKGGLDLCSSHSQQAVA